jgi:hypothetical protein
MSEQFEVSFYILCNTNDDDNFSMRIVESVKKIAGIVSVSHVHGTNKVEGSANWTESEYHKRIDEIKKIIGSREIRIVKKIRYAVRSVTDYVKVSDRVTSWKIKTAKAKKISRVIDASIIKKSLEMEIKIKFLIFGPGKNTKEYTTHRLAIKKLIETTIHQKADFPEDLDSKANALPKEYFLMMEYDYTIIIMMSMGSVSEYSTFFTKRRVGHKIRLFILKKHARSRSYLATGPIRIFRNHYGHVYAFCQSEDLIEKASKMLIDILEYRIMSD